MAPLITSIAVWRLLRTPTQNLGRLAPVPSLPTRRSSTPSVSRASILVPAALATAAASETTLSITRRNSGTGTVSRIDWFVKADGALRSKFAMSFFHIPRTMSALASVGSPGTFRA